LDMALSLDDQVHAPAPKVRKNPKSRAPRLGDWSSRDLGTERTQAELPSAILITAEATFLEKKMAVTVVPTSL
jgi:hypothetical protein